MEPIIKDFPRILSQDDNGPEALSHVLRQIDTILAMQVDIVKILTTYRIFIPTQEQAGVDGRSHGGS